MTSFSPTLPPRGRLARLGIVLDADERAASLARLCDRAGIDIIWLVERSRLDADSSMASVVERADEIAGLLERASLGLMVGPDDDPEILGHAAAVQALLAAGRLELAFPFGVDIGLWTARQPGPRRSVLIRDLADVPPALEIADDIALPAWHVADLETASDEVRAEATEAGRDPSTLGVAAVLPVSIGRTQAEADARVAADPIFELVGNPAEVGIFGTLEECQDRVIALAHAGITDLRCIVPATLDVHDVIAQLTAITVGTTDVLLPGSLRSPAPPPPDGWGGRSPVPERPRVSGGSRRR
jgi:alkanesulfonate monooxygenase SsuD/methylene tetrahydromethanopterin reductase-like flavin-dependent oxidoreductase (luciferase family)